MYDAGVLLAIDDNDRRMWTIHHLAVEEGRRLLIPAVIVAQAWRDGRRQVQLGRFLHSCEVVPVGMETAKAAGVLCGKAGTRDVVDATVVAFALAYGAIVFTSDPDDITRLGAAAEVKPGLVVRRV
ncbi:type II toxin-antitoxin system VapC family toxin [Actinoplanes sichuanensis]|uniref:Type II toxin-antitoxin system VapC family toxin n=1 Tax=Actinoplanes sichuanensis TaxID=512349 RepID=A0ABW4A3J0_9ACTN|nr:PIN domain-containing protein [Actinoplanes sichuanensis]